MQLLKVNSAFSPSIQKGAEHCLTFIYASQISVVILGIQEKESMLSLKLKKGEQEFKKGEQEFF